jgi:tetratricopeptide (TPR) repeat protein
MPRSLQIAGFVVGMVVAASAVWAQVPENPPSPSVDDDDWAYTSPGPAKCVEAGNLYLHRGSLKGALSRFQEALRDNPDYAPAYLGLGKVYERMKEKQKALAAYEQYLDKLPSAKDAAEAKEAQRAVARLQKEVGPNSHGTRTSDK